MAGFRLRVCDEAKKGSLKSQLHIAMNLNGRRPNTTLHAVPLGNPETLVVNYWKGGIAFEHTSVEKGDCTNLLEWTIVEYNGSKWVRASSVSREKVRDEIRRRFERDATITDALITTLMHTLVKLQELEDVGPQICVVE